MRRLLSTAHAADDFLAEEEDAGDEGGGADPNELLDEGALGDLHPSGSDAEGDSLLGSDSEGSLPSVLLDAEASGSDEDADADTAGGPPGRG